MKICWLVVTGNWIQGHWLQPPVLSPLSYDNLTTITIFCILHKWYWMLQSCTRHPQYYCYAHKGTKNAIIWIRFNSKMHLISLPRYKNCNTIYWYRAWLSGYIISLYAISYRYHEQLNFQGMVKNTNTNMRWYTSYN